MNTNMNSKGISAVIAVVLLLLVTVSIVFVFSTWISTAMEVTTEKSHERITSTLYKLSSCMKISSVGWNKVYITNCGINGNEVISSRDVNVFIDGLKINFTSDKDEIGPGEMMELTLKGLWKLSLGKHKLRVQLSNGIFTQKTVKLRPHPSAILVYTFDETTMYQKNGKTYIRDLSGKGNDGEIKGELEVVAGRWGEALRFDGCRNTDTDRACEEDIDYVYTEAPQITTTEKLTLAVHFFPFLQDTETYNNHNDIARSQCIGNDAVFGISTNSNFNSNKVINFQIYWLSGNNPSWKNTPSDAARINDWNFALLSLDREEGRIKAFVNGINYVNRTYTPATKPSGYGFAVGYSCGGEFVGIIDQVMLFSQVLDPDEIYWMED